MLVLAGGWAVSGWQSIADEEHDVAFEAEAPARLHAGPIVACSVSIRKETQA
jgi:hypothetical protein